MKIFENLVMCFYFYGEALTKGVRKLPIFNVVGLTFVVLKLIGTITWSWWYVLMPFYLPWLIGITVVLLMAAITTTFKRSNDKW